MPIVPERTFKKPPPDIRPLTRRQTEVVRMIADGYTLRQIASIMGISYRTVDCHRTDAMKRSGSASRAHLIRYAVAQGIVK